MFRIRTALLALACLGSSTALAAPDECTFLDTVSQELRACEEGPSELAWRYLEKDEWGELRLAERYADEFAQLIDPVRFGFSDSGDPEYDQTDEERDAWREFFEGVLTFLRILFALVGGAEEVLDTVGLTGGYDGSLYTGPANAKDSEAQAFMQLEHGGGEVHGKLIILDDGLELDGGVCGDLTVPVMVLPVHASETGPFSATGTTSRSVSILGIFSGTVDLTFNMSMETTDHRVVVGQIIADPPFPCPDSVVGVRFERRNEDLF